MGHFVVGDDATGIGIGKATLDHHAERQLPDQLFMRAVVGLLLQQADEVFFGCGHERTLAPADGKHQSRRDLAHRGNLAETRSIAASSVREAIVGGLSQAEAEKLVAEAHQICPYSNARRRNIDVDLEVAVV
jgi:organic hydroperoxide reductase OsmC/OhrA